jgi:two-component system cell cycle sensor histidine kinase/response regulator CckA
MTTQDLDKGWAMDALPGERRGSIQLVLLVAIALIGAASALMFLGRSEAERYVFALLAVLGMIGVFSLFAAAAGILRVAGKGEGNAAFKYVLDDAFDGVAVTDDSGRVVYANAAYCRLVDPQGLNDVRPVERVFIGDPDASEAVYRLLKAAREGRRLQEEVRISAVPHQPARWLQLRVHPLRMGGAAARYAVWTVSDVTRERERQEKLFQELQTAIDYLDHAPAGFFSVDAAGHIGYVNATLAGWLDYDLTAIGSGGLTLADILPGDEVALLASRAPSGEDKTEVLDIHLKTRAGKTLPVRLYHNVVFSADGSPEPSRTLVLNRARDDGNDLQRAAEARFMRFFHNTPMAIATVDRAGRIARNNALLARMFQGVLMNGEIPPEGRSILSIVAERDRAAVEAAIAKAAGRQGQVAPVDAGLAGESERWARFYVTAVEDDADQERAIVYALETTEQRALQKQVDQAQKMDSVGKLAGGIAHDFNNVLSAIMMATDFLLNAHRPTDQSFQDIMQIKQNANRAAALVRQLLAFSRRQTLRPQVLDLGEALSDISMLLKRLIGEKVSLDVKHGRDLWPVKVDISQFEQVIVNLAVNARDAMPDGGKLMLRTANVGEKENQLLVDKGMPAGDYVLIEVADTGTGIPPEIIDKIFEPFFSTKEVGMGTGLGLSTVYGIIKQTGGSIDVDSEIGRGTIFRIFLPRHIGTAEEISAAEQPTTTDATKATPADHTGHGTVLLVEDEEGLRALNARGLVSRGYTVCEASNGAEAIKEIDKGRKIDLVVSDVVMPEMDGPTLLKELRRRDPDLKIIFVSGYAEEAFAKNLPEGGQFAFLAKPFTLKQLVAAVKETMAP